MNSGKTLFRFKWDGGEIVYQPLKGLVQDCKSGRIAKIKNPPFMRFPDYSHRDISHLKEKFKPVCLTVYMGHRCNLSCRYCYASHKYSSEDLNIPAIRAAAEFVASNCAEKTSPFILGFHGGTEPLLKLNSITNAFETCRSIAQEHGIELLAFCTTNGVVSNKSAIWAADFFHEITLSWDGPSKIHDRFRITKNHFPISEITEQTAQILMTPEYGLENFKVRGTITKESASKIPLIVKFLQNKGVKNVDFFPVYQNFESTIPAELIPDPYEFTEGFIKARQWGKERGMAIQFAACRVQNFHDRFCPVLQNNLTLTPDGYLTACFQALNNTQKSSQPYIYGHFDESSDSLRIDWDRLSRFIQQLDETPPECRDCFNRFHCAKRCPGICPIQKNKLNCEAISCIAERTVGITDILTSVGCRLTFEQLMGAGLV